MTIYVDQSIWPYRGQLYCHMVSDHSTTELHNFAQSIGLKRAWYQNKNAQLPHYDLSPSKRKVAISKGAIEIDASELVVMLRNIYGEHPIAKDQSN